MDPGRTVETERLREEMEHSRASIAETARELRGAVSHAIDWRERVKAHPGASLGVAASAGVVVGHWLGGKIAGGDGTRAAPATAAPPGAPSARLLDGSLNRAGTRMESLVNLVIDEVADAVETAAIVPLFARLRGFLRTTTGPTGLPENEKSAADLDDVRPAADEPAWTARQAGAAQPERIRAARIRPER